MLGHIFLSRGGGSSLSGVLVATLIAVLVVFIASAAAWALFLLMWPEDSFKLLVVADGG